jgi:hypothetical protein
VNPLTGVISEAWTMYKAHARHFLTIAFVIYLIASVIEALLGVLGPIGALLAIVVSLIASFLLQATLIKAVEDVRDGRVDLSVGETVQAARPVVGSVALASILAGFGIIIGLVLLIVPGLILLTFWCLIVPVIVLERVDTSVAFRRSRELVRGYGWQVFGTLVLVFLLLLVVSAVIAAVFSAFPEAVSTFLGSLVSGTLVSPFVALVVTLGYFRLLAAHGSAGPAPGSAYGAPPNV